MSDILSQAEIESLLSSLASEPEGATSAEAPGGEPMRQVASAQPPAAAAGRKVARSSVAYEIYDFRRPDKFSKDQLRTLQMLHETFARLAGSSLSATLRTPVNIELISLEQVPYEEYLRSINQSVFTIMSLPPLTGQAVLELEFGLVFSMVDRLLGGPGKAISRNVLTEIERPLVRQLIERMFNALKNAWEGVVVVNPGVDGMETSAQFVQIAPPNDIVITILFEVKIGSQRSAMSLCIPYLLLKPITTKLSAQRWFVSSNRKHSVSNRQAITTHINRAEIDCSVQLGKARIKVRQLLDLSPGDVVKLDQATGRDLTFNVGEIPKFAGKPALRGKRLVFGITDSLDQ